MSFVQIFQLNFLYVYIQRFHLKKEFSFSKFIRFIQQKRKKSQNKKINLKLNAFSIWVVCVFDQDIFEWWKLPKTNTISMNEMKRKAHLVFERKMKMQFKIMNDDDKEARIKK